MQLRHKSRHTKSSYAEQILPQRLRRKTKTGSNAQRYWINFREKYFRALQNAAHPWRLKPCQAIVTEWSGYYEKEKYSPPDGYILLEDSKATCPIGGKDCIKIIKTGQIGEPTKRNFENADSELQSHVNPLVDVKNYESKDPYEFLNAE